MGRAWFILATSARARRCAPRTERNGGFGFQTKVKDRQFSFTFFFVFILKSLLSLLFTSCYAMEAFHIFFYIIIYLIPQCLLNILQVISRYIIQHVMCTMPCLVLFIFVNTCYVS